MSGTRRPFGISVMPSGLYRILGPDLRHVVEVARIADNAGIDELLLGDHVVMGERVDRYPYGPFAWAADDDTTVPGGPKIGAGEPAWPEPLTVLAAMASATTRIRLGTGVLLAPLRPAPLLAKTVATLDVLSGGRVELGVGVGWQPEEYDALGLRFADRWQYLDDTLRACRVLWEHEPPASFTSATVRFERVYCAPQPLQHRLPIFFGARATEAVVRRIAELGDGWFPLGNVSPSDIANGTRRIRDALRSAGRDPSSLTVRAALPLRWTQSGALDRSGTAAEAATLADAGVTMMWVVVGPHLGLRTMPAIGSFLQTLAALPHG